MGAQESPTVFDDKTAHEVTTSSRDGSESDVVVANLPISKVPKQTWRSYIWDTFDKSPEERRFLFKLDAIILTFASLGYFIKNLDQYNINNAFVSGMQEDLGLYKNQLNYMTTFWTVGYVIGEIPSNMLLTRIRPSVWIPTCELTWSVLTILLSQCKSAQQIYVLRFFIGFVEAAFYPGMQYVIGSWYRKDELAKRSTIFHASGQLGGMFSGYLMAATYRLDGQGGYKGWQWLFIVNTIISLPIAIAGFFFFPDVPEITKSWPRNRGRYSLAKFRKIFSSWHIYALPFLYICFNNGAGYGGQPAFQLWLKSEGYGVAARNSYPTIAAAIAVVLALIYAWSSDSLFKGARWPPMIFAGTVNIITASSLAAWDIPIGWKWTCYMLGWVTGGLAGLEYSWANEICSEDNEERAFVIASMNTMAYVCQSWLPLIIWQQVESPRYQKGFITSVVLTFLLIVTALTIRFLHARELAQKARARSVE
ncbi:pantothenate transporter liz1 [Bisporella sp. PMI_857]|nr:pantothenate transporter liz1 [Bisporella sp. PMI_857]KAH8600528.1 pantothenate transporter liz1 [Bisporella sp. PMI_857]